MLEPGRPTSVLIDTIVLAFSRSRMKDLVGTDALRSVLAGTKDLVPAANTLSLAPVWQLLEGQPGFVAEDALAPMCRIKAWEPHLKVIVELPGAAAALDVGTRARHAADCYIDERDLMKVLSPPVRPATPPAGVVVITAERVQGAEITQRVRFPDTNRRTVLAASAAAIAVLAVAISAYLTFGGRGSTHALSPDEVSKEIPLAKVRQSGTLIGATLSDPAWLGAPEAERRAQIERAFAHATEHGARDLVVYDAKGKLVATAASQRGRVVVTFVK
jgi:hypothetical protein